jgi:putative YhbY family RNA-binding protein
MKCSVKENFVGFLLSTFRVLLDLSMRLNIIWNQLERCFGNHQCQDHGSISRRVPLAVSPKKVTNQPAQSSLGQSVGPQQRQRQRNRPGENHYPPGPCKENFPKESGALQALRHYRTPSWHESRRENTASRKDVHLQKLRDTPGPRAELPSANEVGIWDSGVNYLLGLWDEETVPNSEGTTFEKKKLRRLQAKSRELDATICIGKDGASEELFGQVSNQLKTRELVKLKVHKSALADIETSELAEKVSATTESVLVEVIGHTFTLFKRRVEKAKAI